MTVKQQYSRDSQRSQQYHAVHKNDERYGGPDSECSLAENKNRHVECLSCTFKECKLKKSTEQGVAYARASPEETTVLVDDFTKARINRERIASLQSQEVEKYSLSNRVENVLGSV